MNWIILINFIASILSIGIIWKGFCKTDSYYFIFGMILLIINLSYFIFNLTRSLYE